MMECGRDRLTRRQAPPQPVVAKRATARRMYDRLRAGSTRLVLQSRLVSPPPTVTDPWGAGRALLRVIRPQFYSIQQQKSPVPTTRNGKSRASGLGGRAGLGGGGYLVSDRSALLINTDIS